MDCEKDIIEVFIQLIGKSKTALKPSLIRVKDLKINTDQNEIWNLSMSSLLNLRYSIFSERVRESIINNALIEGNY